VDPIPDNRYLLIDQQDQVVEEPSDEKKVEPVKLKMTRAMRAMSSAINHSTTVKTRLVAEQACVSSGGGTFYLATALYTVLIALGEEDSFQSLFRQFRITNINFHYIPYTPYKAEASINTNGRPIVIAVDPDDSSAPSSLIQIFANASAKCFHTQQTGVLYKWRNDDKRWFNTASTTNPLQPALTLKMAADAALGTSIPFGGVLIEFFVEYRARL
jgi:cellobiose phosphorylase